MLGLVGWSRWGYMFAGSPNVVISDATSHVSIPTFACDALDVQGSVQGAAHCLDMTSPNEPTEFFTVTPGQRLSFSLSGSGFDYALLRFASRPVRVAEKGVPHCRRLFSRVVHRR